MLPDAMLDTTTFIVFLGAALVLAVTPGPGIFYVLARSLRGGRRDGVRSSLGTAIGGAGHVVAAACGLSALLASSATAFAVVKYAGGAYLIYLGIRTLLTSEPVAMDAGARGPSDAPVPGHDGGAPARRRHASRGDRALVQGVITELLNPKTALFFLAFIPQFIEPKGHVFAQFVLLGSISVALNTSADLVVAVFAGPLGDRLRRSARFRRTTRMASGGALIGLGAYAAMVDSRR